MYMMFSDTQLTQEADRLFQKLQKLEWSREDCDLYAPMTLEINTLKKEQDAIILAHSYQTPDIMYGVADFVGDSYGLSLLAAEHECKKIVFCSVHFMGETAKLLSPDKEVLVPQIAGCSLAESITAEDVRNLRAKHPNAGVVCYINTTAAVKAECDVSCTSSNVLKVIESISQDEIIFVPDKLMGQNIQKLTSKKLILWDGTCIVHEEFTPEKVSEIRKNYPDVKILAHPECAPQVVDHADFTGSTSAMMQYVADHEDQNQIMLITECGITDRVKSEYSDREIVGTCNMCPYMKKIMMKDILESLKSPREDQIVKIPGDVAQKAKASLDKMFEVGK
jgi:quinolinate synthase